jgi:hypothetical protein
MKYIRGGGGGGGMEWNGFTARGSRKACAPDSPGAATPPPTGHHP